MSNLMPCSRWDFYRGGGLIIQAAIKIIFSKIGIYLSKNEIKTKDELLKMKTNAESADTLKNKGFDQ